MEEKRLEFYGGVWVSFLPFLIFVAITLTFLVMGAPDVRGMWIASMAGIMITFFVAKDRMYYASVIVKGMGEPGTMFTIITFLVSAMFATAAGNIDELLDSMMQSAVASTGKTLVTLNKEDKVAVVRYLDGKGAFLIKKSAERVAEFLGISRFTVYNYLNEPQEGIEQ